MKTFNGWIVDIYLAGREVAVQVIDTNGDTHSLRDSFIPVFYVGGDAKDLRTLARFLIDQTWDVRISRTPWTEPAREQPIIVLQVEVMNPPHFATIVERVMRAKPKLQYYNEHAPVLQQYFKERGIIPFARYHFVIDDKQRILGFEVIDSSPSVPMERKATRR